MNFAFLAHLDVFDLACSLRSRMGLFQRGEAPQLLPVRGPRSAEDGAMVVYRDCTRQKWPELHNTLQRVQRIGKTAGNGIEFDRIFLECLQPGNALPWTPPEAEAPQRAIVALRTNPAAIVHLGTESAWLMMGNLTLVSRAVWSSAVNFGEGSRIHLVIDFRRKE